MREKAPKELARKDSATIVSASRSGVVPAKGIEHIAVGRVDESKALVHDLKTIAAGASTFRVIVGDYGSGKSFMLHLLRTKALEKGLVVARVQLDAEHRLASTSDGGQALATYRALLGDLSTKTKAEGGALSTIVDKWLSYLLAEAHGSGSSRRHDESLYDAVEKRIGERAQAIRGLVHGFDFSRVIQLYWQAYRNNNDQMKDWALRWLRGEYSGKAEAWHELGVKSVIDDSNWLDYIKVMADFVVGIGYSGLLILLDEAVSMMEMPSSTSRLKNYEQLCKIYNEATEGRMEHCGFVVAVTNEGLENGKRGFYSYNALRSRLSGGRRFSKEGLVDARGPVIRLSMLSNEEILVLLSKLAAVHAMDGDYEERVTRQELAAFMKVVHERLGASEFLKPRELIMDFVYLLDLLQQNPKETFSSLTQDKSFRPRKADQSDDVNKGAKHADFDLEE